MNESPATAVARAALRGLWFVVLPALLAALTLRYLVPTPEEAAGSWALSLARAGEAKPLMLGVGLFVLFTLVVRYWRFALPGAFYLTVLPMRMAARVRGTELRTYAQAAELLRALRDERRTELDARVNELSRAIEEGDVTRIEREAAALSVLATPLLRARQRRQMASSLLAVAAAGVAALVFRSSMFGSYQVLSGSMLPTLSPGDFVATNKLAYGFRVGQTGSRIGTALPRRGDVIVFKAPPGVDATDEIVKRVIGLPGDRITMRGPAPVINGWQVPACDAGSYVYAFSGGAAQGRVFVEFLGDAAYLTLFARVGHLSSGPFRVRPGEVFVLGDNRNNSSDSRAWNGGNGGGVPFGNIDGRAQRFLAPVHRNQRLDLGGLLRPFDLKVRVEGVDVSAVEQGVQRCLRDPPLDTRPPEGDEKTALSTAASVFGGGG